MRLPHAHRAWSQAQTFYEKSIHCITENANVYPSGKSGWILALFLISKREFIRKVKNVKELRGGVRGVRRTRNSAD
jgi:hypothetical protein